MTALMVVLGGLIGAPLRLWVTRTAVRAGRDPSAGTLAANVLGCTVLGLVTGLAEAPGAVVAFVGTGFCGTLTTFSTFGADVLRLAEARRLTVVLGHVTTTLVLGLGAAAVTRALVVSAG